MALHDEIFWLELHCAIVEYFENNTGTVHMHVTLWEAFMAYIRVVCISKHAGILRDLRGTLARIEAELATLERGAAQLAAETHLP